MDKLTYDLAVRDIVARVKAMQKHLAEMNDTGEAPPPDLGDGPLGAAPDAPKEGTQ